MNWNTPEFWSKHIVQAAGLAAAGYALYNGQHLTPEQWSLLIKAGLALAGGTEVGHAIANSLKNPQIPGGIEK